MGVKTLRVHISNATATNLGSIYAKLFDLVYIFATGAAAVVSDKQYCFPCKVIVKDQTCGE
jgi:hypothetical protein